MKNYSKTIQTILLTISLFGCYTPQKANKALNKAYNKQPREVAAFTRDKFPCIESSIDTIYQFDTSYDFIEIECPDQPIQVKDTIYLTKNGKTKIVQTSKEKTIALPQKTVTIIKKIEDSAKIAVLAIDNKDCAHNVQKLSQKLTNRNYWILSLLILLLISLFVNFSQYTGRRFLDYINMMK